MNREQLIAHFANSPHTEILTRMLEVKLREELPEGVGFAEWLWTKFESNRPDDMPDSEFSAKVEEQMTEFWADPEYGGMAIRLNAGIPVLDVMVEETLDAMQKRIDWLHTSGFTMTPISWVRNKYDSRFRTDDYTYTFFLSYK